jgi:hypothetical protein
MPDESTNVDVIGLVERIRQDVNRLAAVMDDVADDTKAVIIHELEYPMKDLRWVAAELKRQVGKTMHDKNLRSAIITSPAGKQFAVQASWKIGRTKVDRDGLVRAIERQSSDQRFTIDTETGEVISPDQAKLTLLKRCFRFDPRWSEIKEAGVDDDEFCQKTFDNTVKVLEGGTL